MPASEEGWGANRGAPSEAPLPAEQAVTSTITSTVSSTSYNHQTPRLLSRSPRQCLHVGIRGDSGRVGGLHCLAILTL